MRIVVSESPSAHAPQPVISSIAARSGNKLLAGLPLEDYSRIAPHLTTVVMTARKALYKQDAPIDSIYFPNGGAYSLVKTTENGNTAEIAVIGSEGVIGASVFFGLSSAPCDVIAQMSGPVAELMPVRVFAAEMDRHGAFYNRLIRYNQALMMQIMQTTVCNGLHSAQERCARWLLTIHDRARQDEFPFVHEFVATMLGLRRPTVTIVTGRLEAAGLIEHRRGNVKVVDRAGLEAASCECYRVVRKAFDRLLPEVSLAEFS